MLLPAQVIQKKRDGHALTEEEIRFFVDGFTSGELPEYQMSALAMAICFQGMNFDETMWLTRAMVESGKVVQWRGAKKAVGGARPPGAPSCRTVFNSIPRPFEPANRLPFGQNHPVFDPKTPKNSLKFASFLHNEPNLLFS